MNSVTTINIVGSRIEVRNPSWDLNASSKEMRRICTLVRNIKELKPYFAGGARKKEWFDIQTNPREFA